MSRDDRRGIIKSKNLCFRCFGAHSAMSCKRNVPCMYCNNTGHNKMICTFATPRNDSTQLKGTSKVETPSYKKSNHFSVGIVDNGSDKTNNGYDENFNRNENRCTRYERAHSNERAVAWRDKHGDSASRAGASTSRQNFNASESVRHRSVSPLDGRRAPRAQ